MIRAGAAQRRLPTLPGMGCQPCGCKDRPSGAFRFAWASFFLLAFLMSACLSLDHSNPVVRKEALRDIADPAVLTRVALWDNDFAVRKAAVEKLTSQPYLAEVATQSHLSLSSSPTRTRENQDIHLQAVRKLTDQVLLTKVALAGSDPYARMAAVEQLTDQNLLAKVAAEAKEGARIDGRALDVREAAFDKVTDQTLLARIALEGKILRDRQKAIERLTDQAILTKIALESKGGMLRRIVVNKLTDQALLAKLAAEDRDGSIREAAFKKVTDPTLLASVSAARIRLHDDDYAYYTVELPEIQGVVAVKHAKILKQQQDGAFHPEVTFELLAREGEGSLYARVTEVSMTEVDGTGWRPSGLDRSGGVEDTRIVAGQPATLRTRVRLSFADSYSLTFLFYDERSQQTGPSQNTFRGKVAQEGVTGLGLKSSIERDDRTDGCCSYRLTFGLRGEDYVRGKAYVSYCGELRSELATRHRIKAEKLVRYNPCVFVPYPFGVRVGKKTYTGVTLNNAFSNQRGESTVRAEFHVNLRDRDLNRKLFERLREQAAEIEKEYGTSLMWEQDTSDHHMAFQIAAYREGSIDAPEEQRAEMLQWSIQNLLQLIKVIAPRMEAILAKQTD